MKYWVAILGPLGERENRLWFVTEKEENEPGLTKVSEKPKWSSESFDRWIPSDQIEKDQKVWIDPVDDSTKENYRCNLIGIDPFKDRADIERFAMNGFRAIIQWVEVSKEIFDWLDGSGWCDAVMDLLSDPKLDFKSEIVFGQTWISPDEKMILRLSQRERMKYPPRVSIVLVEVMKGKMIPDEIISFLCPEE